MDKQEGFKSEGPMWDPCTTPDNNLMYLKIAVIIISIFTGNRQSFSAGRVATCQLDNFQSTVKFGY